MLHNANHSQGFLKKNIGGMVHLKKIISITTVGLTLVAMVGCSSSTTSTTASNASTTQQPAQHAAQQTTPEHQHQPKALADNQELLTLLKIDGPTLNQELKANKSLADIAAEKKVPEQQVIDVLVKQSSQRMDQAVQAGKLTKDKADQMKAKMQDQIKKNVERKGGFGFSGKHGAHGDHHPNHDNGTSSNAQN